ncbi:MAG: hypothetical protein HFI71_12320 [Lachnospiraceae bacterium]|nr:hypothetical protein [Lachnospiraceae bacterium]
MTEVQRKWTDNMIERLRKEAERRKPLSDRDWEEMKKSVSMIFLKSKKNVEVKNALVKFLLECEEQEKR